VKLVSRLDDLCDRALATSIRNWIPRFDRYRIESEYTILSVWELGIGALVVAKHMYDETRCPYFLEGGFLYRDDNSIRNSLNDTEF